jgi:hypothetical protein
MIDAHSSMREVAFAVCTTLHNAGIVAVLTGGSAATIWTSAAYQSRDCDFIIAFSPADAAGTEALQAIGFNLSGNVYVHQSNPFTVDFPPGPLSIGQELITTWETLLEEDGILQILSPTDSCKDRLAAFYHWNDRSSLAVAKSIAELHPLDMDRIAQWSHNEGCQEKFRQFVRELK